MWGAELSSGLFSAFALARWRAGGRVCDIRVLGRRVTVECLLKETGEAGVTVAAVLHLFDFFLIELMLLHFEALALDEEAFGEEVAAAEAGDIGAELAEVGPSGGGVLFGYDERVSRGGVLKGGPVGELVGERFGEGLVAKGVLVLEVLDEIKRFLADEPIAEAAIGPFSEVDGTHGASAEVFGEDGTDFGQGIEPIEDGFGLLAVVEAAVELVADLMGEAGDFSVTHK